MSNRGNLRPLEVLDIKARLWNGETPYSIIESYSFVSRSLLSGIKWGRVWVDIAWPDGSLGGMNPGRAREILKRFQATKRLGGTFVDHRTREGRVYPEQEHDKEEYRRMMVKAAERDGTPVPTVQEIDDGWREHLAFEQQKEADRIEEAATKHRDALEAGKKAREEYERSPEYAKEQSAPLPVDPLRGLRPLKDGKPNIPDLLKYTDKQLKQIAPDFPKHKDEILAVISLRKKMAKQEEQDAERTKGKKTKADQGVPATKSKIPTGKNKRKGG